VYAIAKKKRIQILIGLLLTVALIFTAIILPSERNPGKMYPPDENAAWAKLEGMTEIPVSTYSNDMARYYAQSFGLSWEKAERMRQDPTSRWLYMSMIGGYPDKNRRFNIYGFSENFVESNYQTVHSAAVDILASNKTDKEIALAAARWVAAQISYDDYYSWFEGLSANKGACQVYTELYCMLASECGLPTFSVFGTDHTWSGVYIDGKWRFTDLTWLDTYFYTIEQTGYIDYSSQQGSGKWVKTGEQVVMRATLDTFDDYFGFDMNCADLKLISNANKYKESHVSQANTLKVVPAGSVDRNNPDIRIFGGERMPFDDVSYSIADADIIEETSSVGMLGAFSYTGSSITPPVTISMNGRMLTEGTDYTLTYGANKKIGKGKLTITGKGYYTGSRTLRFDIVPTSNKINKLKKAKKAIKVTFSAVPKAQKITKYQVAYKQKGQKKWKVKTIKPKLTKITLKKLKTNKRYEVRVRSYKTLGGVRYCSAWSKVKTVRTG
jgi:hypothetical protein